MKKKLLCLAFLLMTTASPLWADKPTRLGGSVGIKLVVADDDGFWLNRLGGSIGIFLRWFGLVR